MPRSWRVSFNEVKTETYNIMIGKADKCLRETRQNMIDSCSLWSGENVEVKLNDGEKDI